VGDAGSAHGRFVRAIKTGNLWAAESAAREIRGLSLYDALDLCELIARAKPEKYDRAAVRWHGRLELEATTLTLSEAELALAAIAALPDDPGTISELLQRLLRRAHPTHLRPMR
jgi:hypothetical protein